MAEFGEIPNLGGGCEKPKDPPKGPVTYSCIYEFYAVVDCSAGNFTQKCWRTIAGRSYPWWHKASGTILTRTPAGSVNIPSSLGVTRQGPYQPQCYPFSYPVLLGLVSPDEWAKIKGVGVPQDGTVLNKWIAASHHNQLGAPNRSDGSGGTKERWVILKYYMEVTHVAPHPEDGDPPAGPFICPNSPDQTHANFPPHPMNQEYTEAGLRCPNYYKLEVCTDCSGYNANQTERCKKISDIYWEMPMFETLRKPIIRYPIVKTLLNQNGCFIDPHPLGEYECYKWTKLAMGPRTDNDEFIDIDFVTGGQVYDDDNSGKYPKNYLEMDKCQDCYQDYFVAIHSLLMNPVCDPSSIDRPMNAGAQATAASCISGGGMAVAKWNETANTSAFIARHGKTFFYKGGDGTCYKWVMIDPNNHNFGCVPKIIETWTHYGVPPNRAQYQSVSNYILHSPLQFEALYKIYRSACECYDDGGRVSSAIENWCNPPVLPPRITQNLPANTNANQGQTITLTINAQQVDPARAGVPVTYQWFKNGNPIGGETSRTLVLDNLTLGLNGGMYHCEASNLGNNGQKQSVPSVATRLFVRDIAIKLFQANKKVYKIVLHSGFFSTPIRPGGPPTGRFNMLGSWWTETDLSSVVGKYNYQDNGGSGTMFKIISCRQEEWGNLDAKLRGVVGNDETRNRHMSKSGAPHNNLTQWHDTTRLAYTRA